MLKCPKCGHDNRPGTFSCDNCSWVLDDGLETIKVSDELMQELSSAYSLRHIHNPDIKLPPQALRLVVEASHKTITLMPNEKPYLVGRRTATNSYLNVDLSVHNGEELGVSRRHAILYQTEEGWIVEDLESTNGTIINDHRLGKKELYIIQTGDLLRFGLLAMQVQIG